VSPEIERLVGTVGLGLGLFVGIALIEFAGWVGRLRDARARRREERQRAVDRQHEAFMRKYGPRPKSKFLREVEARLEGFGEPGWRWRP
jgi:hypothetical protein